MLPGSDGRRHAELPDQDADRLIEVVQALAEGHAALVRLVSGVLESNGRILAVLDELAARLAASDLADPAEALLRDPRAIGEAVRREARENAHHSGALIARSRALTAESDAVAGDALTQLLEDGRALPPADRTARPSGPEADPR